MGKSAICCCIPIGDQECREDTKTMHRNIQQRGTGLQGHWDASRCVNRYGCDVWWRFQEGCVQGHVGLSREMLA